MTDEDFRLVPGTAVTPDLLWSGLVLLAERLRATSIDVAEHRRESAERHELIVSRLGHLEDRVSILERTALTEPQHAQLADDQRRQRGRASTRHDLTSYLLQVLAAALVVLILGTAVAHYMGVSLQGTPIVPIHTPHPGH